MIIKGKTFSENKNIKNFKLLLDFSKSLWKEKKLNEKQKKEFHQKCNNFYKLKNYKRINDFIKKYNIKTNKEFINNEEVPNIFELLKKINWNELSNGIPVRFHGDYHFENIIFNKRRFLSIDWRQDFAGELKFGDLYYDLAKLLHGLIVSHELVNKNMFSVDKNDNIINYNLLRKHNLVENEKQFFNYIQEKNWDPYKVKLLTSIIFLLILITLLILNSQLSEQLRCMVHMTTLMIEVMLYLS